MPRVVHFEIAADEPERASRFYERVFGWKVKRWEGPIPYWLVSTGEGPGIDGALVPREGALAPVVNTIDVPSVDAYVQKVKDAGGRVIAGKEAIPGVGWFAACADTEGNPFGVLQSDPGAR